MKKRGIHFLPPGWSFPTSEKRERCERDITFIKISNARDITLSIRVQYFFIIDDNIYCDWCIKKWCSYWTQVSSIILNHVTSCNIYIYIGVINIGRIIFVSLPLNILQKENC